MRKNRIADEKKMVRARCDEIRARIKAIGVSVRVPPKIINAPHGVATIWVETVVAAHHLYIVRHPPGDTLSLNELKERESILNALYLGIA